MLVAKSVDGGVTWIHSDHLHSATVLTDSDGQEIRRLAYAAFGEEAENTGSGAAPAYTYTGKELDDTGLLYYGARYYDPALARFITPDTLYDAGPQGLNRYSYALNNPIRYTDPTGHFIMGPDDENDPGAYGSITGFQDQLNDGTATVHDGGTGESNQTLNELEADGSNFPDGPPERKDKYLHKMAGETAAIDLQLFDEVYALRRDGLNPPDPANPGDITLQDTQVLLDVAGVVDPTPFCDITSGIISLFQGRWRDALGSGTSAFPYIGDALGKGGIKYGAAIFGLIGKRSLKAGDLGFDTFSALKRYLGSAGSGKAWHHIVEQTPGNIRRFGKETIHNVNNIIDLPTGDRTTVHGIISAYYSSKRPFTGGLTVRQWLSTQSFEAQYDFGINIIKQVEAGRIR